MSSRIRTIMLLPVGILLGFLLPPAGVHAGPVSGSVVGSVRVQYQDNVNEMIRSSFLNRLLLAAPDEDGASGYAVVRPEFRLEAFGMLEAGLGFNSGEISSGSIGDGDVGDRARDTFFLERADLQVFLFRQGWASIRGGLWNVRSGEGFLLDYPLVGLELEGDLDVPYAVPWCLWGRVNKVDLDGPFDPDRESYLVDAGAGYAFDLQAGVRVFYNYFHDPDNYFRDLINPVLTSNILRQVAAGRLRGVSPELIENLTLGLVEPIQESSSYLHYLGAAARKEFGRVAVDGMVIWEWGEIDLVLISPLPPQSVPVRGVLADANAGVTLGPGSRMRGGIFFSAGDGFTDIQLEISGGDRKIWGFFSILPLITKTNLFFNGGISENLFTGSALASGIDGNGVVAPNAGFQFEPARRLGVDLTAATLWAQEERAGLGSHYGEEIDLIVTVSLSSRLQGLAEADVLFPGDFFPPDQGVVYRMAAGVDYRFDL